MQEQEIPKIVKENESTASIVTALEPQKKLLLFLFVGGADKDERVDRAAAMQQISDTFGYGEGKKPTFQRGESKPGPSSSERRQTAQETIKDNKMKVGT